MRTHLNKRNYWGMPNFSRFACTLITCLLVSLSNLAQTKHRCIEPKQKPTELLKIDKNYKKWKSNPTKELEKPSNSSFATIPVVVHVLYRTNAENISDAQIQSQIAVLNEDYNKDNNWQATIGAFVNLADNANINFELATIDPDGNPTTGITRKQTAKNGFDYTANEAKKTVLGGVDPWDVDKYLNIWVVNQILFQGQGGTLGYAQFPGLAPETDGVVIVYNVFGNTGTLMAPFDEGRTATHEIGHWLGLYHLWGVDAQDGCNASDDDLMDDTPLQSQASSGCNTNKTSCGSQDMVQNFMDYSDDICMTLFTQDQVGRMQFILNTERTGFLTPSEEYDVQLSAISNVDGLQCGSTLNPNIKINNLGTKSIATVKMDITVDGLNVYSQNHTLNLSPGSSIDLNLINIQSNGSGTKSVVVSATIVGHTDGNLSNNSKTSSSIINPGSKFEFNISESSINENMDWSISNSGGTVKENSSTSSTTSNGLITQQFCLEEDNCYDFNLSDAFVQDLCSQYNEWDVSTQYKIGDQFVYQGTLYESNVAIWGSDPITFAHFYTNLGPCPSPDGNDFFELLNLSNSTTITQSTLDNYQSPHNENFCVAITTGIIKKIGSLKTYPNPVENIVQTDLVMDQLSLFDLAGRLIINSYNTNQMDLINLPSGSYFLLGNLNKEQFQTTIIKK